MSALVKPPLAVGDKVVAVDDIWRLADEDSPSIRYAKRGDLLEVRRCSLNDYFYAYVAHPDREPGAKFGVHKTEIKPFANIL